MLLVRESFQVDYQIRRGAVDFHPLLRIHVVFALVTVPHVVLIKKLGLLELVKALRDVDVSRLLTRHVGI